MRRFVNFDLKLPLLFIMAFVLQFLIPQIVAFFKLGEDFLPAVKHGAFFILIFTYVLLIIAVILNRKNKYFLILGLGVFLNFVVIALNGGMPVSLEAVLRFGSPEAALRIKQSFDFIHILMSDGTKLKFLADIIPFPTLLPFGMSLISIGDIFISLGVFLVVQNQMVYVGKRRFEDKKKKPFAKH
ncbi:MAG TPA: hypothetical protein ENN38_07360 [Actinobacteria bacterium]|nr:hypothetical protein [Actinomycetota bacterium]